MYSITVPPGEHTLPPLPYPYDALEPIISSESLRIHHDILHRGYVEGLNRTELMLVEARRTGDFDLIKYWEGELAYNGSGDILHSIYWTVMTPPGMGGQPQNYTLSEIRRSFGNFRAFQEQFEQAAIKVEASGWGVLVWNPAWNRLEILQAGKHQNLTIWGSIPILVVDVWEHAYYLDYQNRRGDYVHSWWDLINWFEVERRLLLAMRGQMPLTIWQR